MTTVLLIMLPILILAFTVFCFVFWILMLVHAASKPIPDKVVWVLIIIFAGIIGAVIYYYVIKKKFVEPPAQTSHVSQ